MFDAHAVVGGAFTDTICDRWVVCGAVFDGHGRTGAVLVIAAVQAPRTERVEAFVAADSAALGGGAFFDAFGVAAGAFLEAGAFAFGCEHGIGPPF
jgi:hypothetical protein